MCVVCVCEERGGGGWGVRYTACVCATVLQKGTKAPQAGGKIHTDFEKGFIMAEVNGIVCDSIINQWAP